VDFLAGGTGADGIAQDTRQSSSPRGDRVTTGSNMRQAPRRGAPEDRVLRDVFGVHPDDLVAGALRGGLPPSPPRKTASAIRPAGNIAPESPMEREILKTFFEGRPVEYLNERLEDVPPREVLAHADAMAAKYGVPPTLFRSLIAQESRWNPNAKSPVGNYGYTQLGVGTARDLGVDRNDWRQNIEGGARYLAQQKKAFGRWDQALAAYNAGPRHAAERGTDWSKYKPETQNYVDRITRRNGGSLPRD
jgi:soluble lytic murein transglycosylase-like protein